MATKKGSQIPLKLDPQSNDFILGLNYDNPDQFVRIPISTLPNETDWQSFPIPQSINGNDYLLGLSSSSPLSNQIYKIPINLVPGGSSQRKSNYRSINDFDQLNIDLEYYQFLFPNDTLTNVFLPDLSNLEFFEVEIINISTDITKEIQILDFNQNIIFLLTNTSGIFKGIYFFWDGTRLFKKLVEYFL